MPSTAVSMLSSSDTMILLLLPALGGLPADVTVVPMAWIPAPFDVARPSRGGEGLHLQVGGDYSPLCPGASSHCGDPISMDSTVLLVRELNVE